jgi:hypothetical protein
MRRVPPETVQHLLRRCEEFSCNRSKMWFIECPASRGTTEVLYANDANNSGDWPVRLLT